MVTRIFVFKIEKRIKTNEMSMFYLILKVGIYIGFTTWLNLSIKFLIPDS